MGKPGGIKMFYKMITHKRDKWYKSPDCTVNEIIDYIEKRNQMRDAQIEAIKTYLYLKIGCENQPLYKLFTNGAFNSININELEISRTTREFLEKHPEATALYEYATLTNDDNEEISPRVARAIRDNPLNIDYNLVFKRLFYEVSYTDYLFSLPMGAGKTYLMAAFIFLDLYFAMNEPDNPSFAHNFIVFAPSGLKSSVVPSLKTMQNFDPTWIIPEPSASEIKRIIKFELLDQEKAVNKSNKTKNPNVQKIAIHQPLQELMGLVAVTNAEKVILDRIVETNGQISFLEESDDEKDKSANELRNLVGKIPNLSVFIDEVHHAVSNEIKLRSVVNKWMKGGSINSVIGFSGTPYLERAERIIIHDNLSISGTEITNIVYYYPLINGIGNFLKRPLVKISNNAKSLEIVESGIRQFLDEYKNKTYEGDLTAKLGIYCGRIEKLEEEIYPLVERIVREYGLEPTESILKYHKGNKQYSIPVDSQLAFATLDNPLSKIRIVLLVQIGKEGWDCRSLTGIILSQEGDCPRNMVLQTSCRCLRQVEKGKVETALIYLNESNAEKLNEQLRQQHHISIAELENANYNNDVQIKRYDRTTYLKLPKVDFYQLKVSYKTLVIDKKLDTKGNIEKSIKPEAIVNTIIKTQDFTEEISDIDTTFVERGNNIADYNMWLYNISKESFDFVTLQMLFKYDDILKRLFNSITYEKGGYRYFSSKYRIMIINENIRKAFYEERTYESIEELIPYDASLLNITNFTDTVHTTKEEKYYPDSETVKNIMLDDKGKFKVDSKLKDYVDMAIQMGDTATVEKFKNKLFSHPMKDKSFHYLPYKTDSEFEQVFLNEVLKLSCIKEKELEIYYNGDRALTEFKIKCFKKTNNKWTYIGMYTPDFLIISRKDNKIFKAIIVETKGKIYANDPAFKDKKIFMETAFKDKNNAQYGYERFEYLYLEDTLSETDRIIKTANKIEFFFKEVK